MATRTIDALDPALRHAQAPLVLSSNRQVYEWWYFEVDFEDEDGRPWRVITSFHFPHGLDPRRLLAHQRYRTGGRDFFSLYGDNPAHYAGIASYVVDVRRNKNVALLISRFQNWAVPTRVSVSRPGDARVDLQFGDCSFSENPDGSYTLHVDQTGILYRPGQANRLLTLDMRVKFEQNTPGFQPVDAELLSQGGRKHHWACVMPNPKLTIEYVLVKRARRRKGFDVLCRANAQAVATSGYHDHQWGEDLLYKQIREWSWGRVATAARGNALPRDKVLFFDVTGVSSPGSPGARPDPVIVNVPGDGSHVEQLGSDGSHPPFRKFNQERVDFRAGCQLGIQGQRVPYSRELQVRSLMPSGESRNFNIKHRISNVVDVWPFYLRFIPKVVDFHTGKTLVGISESMRADRLALRDTQRILALSDKLTYII
ncbi:MAG: hypothetical protein JKY37_10830 [Nannocystaceae bacterium]|nr:hypothetical protein [Nannocystaceae bacterium]